MVQYLTYISNLIYIMYIWYRLLFYTHDTFGGLVKKLKNINITEIASFLVYLEYFSMYSVCFT